MSPAVRGPVLIIGTGLVGTSIGLALTAAGVEVGLRDRSSSALRVAAERGAGGLGSPEAPACIVVAVPPGQVAGVVAAALQEFETSVVTDVGSVKGGPLAELTSTIGAVGLGRYVGGHPMAGSELSGPWAASAELFQGRSWAITPHPASTVEAVAAVTALAQATGASVVTMAPGEHDLAVARVSHLPHLLSVLTAAQLGDAPAEHLALSGQGLRDVTRVAAGDPQLWTQIVTANAAALTELLQGVRADVDRLLDGLGAAPEQVGDMLRRGVDGTRRIPAKHGGPARAEAVVVVAVPDQPGELARLFGDAGQSGVSVEDLRIDHDPGRPVGLVEIVVQAAAADTLLDALVARGWLAHR